MAALIVTAAVLMVDPVQNHLVAEGTIDDVSWTANGDVVDRRAPSAITPDDLVPGSVNEGVTDDPTAVRFEPIFYAIDTVVPLVDLGQRATWAAETSTRAGVILGSFLTVMRLLGWVFAAAITFAVARLFQSRHG